MTQRTLCPRVARGGVHLACCALAWIASTTGTKQSLADARPGQYVARLGTVYDTKTKLTWQQFAAPSGYPWREAAQYCSSLALNGMTWRLPSIKELATIVDELRSAPAIDLAAFPNTQAQYFWTSSLVAGFSQYVWAVDFNHGGDNFFDSTSEQQVRCVH